MDAVESASAAFMEVYRIERVERDLQDYAVAVLRPVACGRVRGGIPGRIRKRLLSIAFGFPESLEL